MNIRATIGSIGGTLLGAAGWLADPNHSTVIASLVPHQFSTPLLGLAALILLCSHSVKPSDSTLAAVPDANKLTVGPITFQKTGPLKTS